MPQARFTFALLKDMAKVPFPEDHIFSQTVSGAAKIRGAAEAGGEASRREGVSLYRGQAQHAGKGASIAYAHTAMAVPSSGLSSDEPALGYFMHFAFASV